MSYISELIELYPDLVILTADGFDEAIIGYVTGEERIIYSVPKCIDVLIEQGMSYEDAKEYFDYNVLGSYVGENTPIFLDNIKSTCICEQ